MVLAQAGKVTLHTQQYPLDSRGRAPRPRRRQCPGPGDPRSVIRTPVPATTKGPLGARSPRTGSALVLQGPCRPSATPARSLRGSSGRPHP
jgi:hypothetical protein